MAAKGGFRVGQTAKSRSGHRVQSLPVRDMAAVFFLMSDQRPAAHDRADA